MTTIWNNNVAHGMKVEFPLCIPSPDPFSSWYQIVADHIGVTDGSDIFGNDNCVHDVSVQNGDECVTAKTLTNGFVAENIQRVYIGGIVSLFCSVVALRVDL